MVSCDIVCEIEAASAASNRKEAEQGSHLTGHLRASAEFIWFRRNVSLYIPWLREGIGLLWTCDWN